jgi:hypothetical protein
LRPRSFKVGPFTAASANNIALSQTPTTTVTLNGSLGSGGVATLDNPRRILITTAGAEAGKTMTVVGTTWGETIVTDVLALPSSSTVASVIDFKTVTSMTISSAAAGALTVGTTTGPVAAGPWFKPDTSLAAEIAIQVTVSGTINYTIQQTLDDPTVIGSTMAPYQVSWVSSSDAAVVSATTTKQSNYLFLPAYSRVLINSQTNPAYVTVTYIQAGS